METWKDIDGYDGLYQVSDHGNIKSLISGVILKPLKRKHGYLAVQLHGNGGNKRGFKTYSIHRLVAEAFVENPYGKPEVNHKDENKQNNNASNLEWVTRAENARYGTCTQRSAKHRTGNPLCSRRIAMLDDDGNVLNEFISARDAERKTGLKYANIYNALYKGHKSYGYRWKFIG